MKKTYIMKTVCAVSLTAACAWGLAGCAAGGSSASGGVAGTVNGVEISEDTLTNYVQGVRDQLGASDEDAWGKWLAQNSFTPSSVREELFNSYAQRELVKEGASKKGITVDSSEIDEQVNKVKQNYDTDDKWKAALEQAGMTEDSYRSELEFKLEQSKLYDSFASEDNPSDEDMLKYAQMYASAYNGSKRSSHILFDASDEATAQEVLDKINSGSLDFVDAVKKYSKDTVSADKDGDVGWDGPNNLVQEYKDGLKPLEKGQVSGLVKSKFGIHIIKCTDVYSAPDEVTSLDQIPSEWIDSIKSALKGKKQQEDYQQWLDDTTKSADIKINDMPKGLPYDVDMSKYPAPSDDNADKDGSGDTNASTPSDSANNGDAGATPEEGSANPPSGDTGPSDADANSTGQPPEAS